MLTKQLYTLPLIFFSSIAMAGTFQANDARTNGMGGAGVAAADPVAAGNVNPGLLSAYEQDEDFGLVLPSVGGFIQDPNGFIATATTFIAEDFDSYQNLDFTALNTAITNLQTAASDVQIAMTAYQADPSNNTKYNDLITKNNAMTTAITNAQTEVNSVDSVVDTTETAFQSFSGKPMQAGLLLSLGMALPKDKMAWSFTANNNAYIGAQLGLVASDLAPLSNTTADTSQYLGRVADVNTALTDVIVTGNDLNADPFNTTKQAAFDAAVTAYNGAQTIMNSNTTNNVFVGGTFDSATQTFDINTMTSEVQLLGVNVTEVGGSISSDITVFGQEDVSAGVKIKLQSLTVFEDNIPFSSFESDPTGALQDSTSQNTVSHTTGNIDVGVAKNYEYKGTLTAGMVIRDLIPQSFKSSSGKTISIKPQIRVGVAHKTSLTTLTADLDLTENEPIAYGAASRFLALGTEFNAWNFAKVRAGYRTNLSVSGATAMTMGLAFTPFGAGLDISAWAKPSSDPNEIIQDAGGVIQLSVNF